jgi:hypothetical protein
VSAIELLATLDFRMPWRAERPVDRSVSFSIVKVDPAAFPVTEILREVLQSAGIRVDSAKKEGKGTFFRCIGKSFDIGIAVTVMKHSDDIVEIGLALARLSTRTEPTGSATSELDVDELVHALTKGLAMRLVGPGAFEITGQWRRPS